MTSDVLDYKDIATRYRRMRTASLRLNKVLPEYVSKEGLEATGRKLGILRKGLFVFADEAHTSVMFDQAIHGYFSGGKNAVDFYLAEHPPQPGSDEEAVLAAIKRSFYSVFQVQSVVRKAGVHVHDLLRDRMHFLADLGFSQTAGKGAVLATRVFPFDDFIMTGGAALPVDFDTLTNIFRLHALNRPPHEIDRMSAREMADVAASIIQLCLEGGSSQSIAYQGVDDPVPPKRPPDPAQPRVGRNEPCPCGSGKKYKKCCGR